MLLAFSVALRPFLLCYLPSQLFLGCVRVRSIISQTSSTYCAVAAFATPPCTPLRLCSRYCLTPALSSQPFLTPLQTNSHPQLYCSVRGTRPQLVQLEHIYLTVDLLAKAKTYDKAQDLIVDYVDHLIVKPQAFAASSLARKLAPASCTLCTALLKGNRPPPAVSHQRNCQCVLLGVLRALLSRCLCSTPSFLLFFFRAYTLSSRWPVARGGRATWRDRR